MLGVMPIQKATVPGRALLRLTPQDIHDTEIIPTSAISELSFFNKPYGQTTAYGSLTKGIAETNMKQAGQLARPYAFDLFGFNVKYMSNTAGTAITIADFDKIMLGSYLEFTVGNKVYLQCPLIDIPSGNDVNITGTTTADSKAHYGIGLPTGSNMKKFTIGKFLVHIDATENFGVRLAWTSAITLGAVTRVLVQMQGTWYNAI